MKRFWPLQQLRVWNLIRIKCLEPCSHFCKIGQGTNHNSPEQFEYHVSVFIWKPFVEFSKLGNGFMTVQEDFNRIGLGAGYITHERHCHKADERCNMMMEVEISFPDTFCGSITGYCDQVLTDTYKTDYNVFRDPYYLHLRVL